MQPRFRCKNRCYVFVCVQQEVGEVYNICSNLNHLAMKVFKEIIFTIKVNIVLIHGGRRILSLSTVPLSPARFHLKVSLTLKG